ncbi:MAG TPA: hypothetical protein VIK69_09480 [Methylophilaceae bacterium]|jgi:hypothetical protein
MRKPGLAMLLALFATVTAYAAGPTDDELKAHIGNGAEIEARLDADLTGDGVPDTAFVGRADSRILMVLAGHRDGKRITYKAIGETGLPDGAQAPAVLSLRRNVLVVKDLTGGTTATATTYRYRYDANTRRMRLIGLDAERYSRTNAHAPLKISWNLLTGDHLVHYARPAKKGKADAAYDYDPPERTMRETEPVWMEETPNPDELIDAEVIPADEDRD